MKVHEEKDYIGFRATLQSRANAEIEFILVVVLYGQNYAPSDFIKTVSDETSNKSHKNNASTRTCGKSRLSHAEKLRTGGFVLRGRYIRSKRGKRVVG
jgi:hypothetical protein